MTTISVKVFFWMSIQISGYSANDYINPFSSPDVASADQNSTVDQFQLNNVSISHEIHDNQIIYRTILKDQHNGDNEASLLVRYTFYPTAYQTGISDFQ